MKGVSAKKAASSGSFTNHGGPVVVSPQVISVFWGSSWSDAAHQSQASRLNLFLGDLLNSSLMNLLSQYRVGAGSFQSNLQLMDLNVSGSLTDAQIQSKLQVYFDNGGLPEPSPNQEVIIFLDESVAVNDADAGLVLCEPSGDTAFGYHNFFITSKGNPAYYAIIPALTDACLQESCGSSSGCTLSLSDSVEQRRTEVTTHEFCEMCSDPQLNAWTDAQGNEIGDVCTAKQDITVNGRVWRVQTIWDNNANACTVGSLQPPPSPPPPTPPPPMNPPPTTGSSNSTVVMANLFMLGLAKFLGKV